MKSPRAKSTSSPVASGELAPLRLRLAEVEETLRAIRAGEVDTVMVEGRLATSWVRTTTGRSRGMREY